VIITAGRWESNSPGQSRGRDSRHAQMKFMIRDRGPNFTAAFGAVLSDAGIRTVLCNVRTPRMNAIAERWIGGCRRELLDRTLIWNQSHLRQILRDYETHHNPILLS
jgi:putative transposase